MKRIEGDPLSDIPKNIQELVGNMVNKGAFAHCEWRFSNDGTWYGYVQDRSDVPIRATETRFTPEGTVVEDFPRGQIQHTDDRRFTLDIGGLPCIYIKKP